MKFKRVQFESTNYCSMKCEFCPNRKMTRPKMNLAPELFRQIVDDLAARDLTDTISFAGNGEPSLDPDLANKLKYCHLKNLKTVITTNGLRIDKFTGDLIGNLDCLYISWQTFNEKTFRLRGTSSSYGAYQDKLIEFIGKNRPRLKIVVSLMLNEDKRWLRHDLFGKNFSALFGQKISAWLPAAEKISPAARKNLQLAIASQKRLSLQEARLDENLFLNVDQFSDWGGNLDCYSSNFKRIPAISGSCKIMADGPLVLADGRLSLCCVDYDGKVAVGDLKKESLPSIIDSERYKKIFADFQNKKISLPYCQKCLGRWKHKNELMNFLYKIEDKIYRRRHFKR
ncbi:MAG TPA: radical SAM protein [Candidatus Nanoarchaeia archaeon]|nr:radical SAM protein [Candidatus Nanoarchaeia archaeon]